MPSQRCPLLVDLFTGSRVDGPLRVKGRALILLYFIPPDNDVLLGIPTHQKLELVNAPGRNKKLEHTVLNVAGTIETEVLKTAQRCSKKPRALTLNFSLVVCRQIHDDVLTL
ncbi:MAG: hypothetical protein UU47_C0002G0040 [candidate division TM6 bacterium GW2011_GWE2_41_16]|nr:MAG: hypothetical protein UU47_C0002G0040 [candidate division TM6 bacterium GW2011_GWE2_41_16]